MKIEGLHELALFAGAGGGLLASRELGIRTICAVERNPYAASVLVARQNDGNLEPFPIWDDVRTFDGRPWRGVVDLISGGFPCQDISTANIHAQGIRGSRSGLWGEFARIISEVHPRFVFIENSPALVFRGIDVVLSDLAALGYDAEWGVLGARDVGAPHQRDRVWIMAADPQSIGRLEVGDPRGAAEEESEPSCNRKSLWWSTEPGMGRVGDGVAPQMDRLQALGNGQVPQCAAEAFRRLWSALHSPDGIDPRPHENDRERASPR